ncbi:helix-turn-helix transcriptional regulator [Actinomycetospora sp. CA-101289]|uniref:helix-turn-helix transcriptional regulator n=1 Tax=Actinomycetospora sp. CA-101289 TaxID=3239893 RepID=UPI003D96F4A4
MTTPLPAGARGRGPVNPDEQEWPLGGRRSALRTVNRIAVRNERAGVIAVGPPGVGRTRFARAALVGVGSTGPGDDHPDGPSWHPIWVMASRGTAGIPLGALSHLLPDHDPGDGSPGWLLHEARQVLLRTKGPARLLLGVDDVHLLDETSAVLLHQLASAGDAFLVLTAPTGVSVPEPVFALWKDSLVERIDLPELTREESDALVVKVLGGHVDAATLHRLWSLSLGNPLFLRELVRGARASGALVATGRVWHTDGAIPISARLAEIMHQRTEGSAPHEQSLMRLLAFGQPLGSDLAGELTSPSTVAALEERGIITSRRTGRRVEISLAHPLHTEVLRRAATPYQERQTYQRLADALEARGVRREEDHRRLLAWRVGQGVWSDPTDLVAAAAGALDTDPALAERLLREAATVGDGTAQLEHARVLVKLGRSLDAEQALAPLADDADLSPDLRVAVALTRSYNLFWGLRDAAGARRAIARAGSVDDLPDTGDASALHAFELLLDGDHEGAGQAVAAAVGEPSSDEAPLAALAIAATAAARAGRADEARGFADRGLEAKGQDPTGGWMVVELTAARWYADLEAGRLDEAETTAMTAHGRAVEDGQRTTAALGATWVGIVAARRGRLRTAIRWLLEAAAGVPAESFLFTVPLVTELALAVSSLGNIPRARSLFDEAGDLRVDGPFPGWGGAAQVWLAGLVGQATEAERIALAVAEDTGALGPRIRALHTAVRLGITGPVTDLLDDLAQRSTSELLMLHAAQGRALADHDGEALDEVADRYAAAGLLLDAAETAAQAAVVHRTRGATGSGGGSASRARAWAESCEDASTPALEQLDGVTDLTRREMEIASLAASGLTSKAIANQLGVSVRTVDNILRMVYAKLGVSGRGDLAHVSGIRTTPRADSPSIS